MSLLEIPSVALGARAGEARHNDEAVAVNRPEERRATAQNLRSVDRIAAGFDNSLFTTPGVR